MRRSVPLFVLLVLPLGGCQGWQSVLDAQGPAASSIARMFWIFVAVLAMVWVLTMIALLLSLRRRRPADADPLATNPVTEPAAHEPVVSRPEHAEPASPRRVRSRTARRQPVAA